MLSKFIFFSLLFTQLYATTILKDSYYVDSGDIYLSTLIKDAPKDKIIYKMTPKKHKKRVKSKEIIKLLAGYGYKDIGSKSRYVKFVEKSPIDSSKIVLYLQNYYEEHYVGIDIKDVVVAPRSYMRELPPEYSVEIRDRNYLLNDGLVSIKTAKNRKIFFNYTIKANVLVYYSKHKIKKGTQLSTLNSTKKTIQLDRFMAKPLQTLNSNSYQSKHTIQQNKIITMRDTTALDLVKRGAKININLNNNNISISFSATAIQSGKINDIITVKQANGKKIKVKIIGKNRAEMR